MRFFDRWKLDKSMSATSMEESVAGRPGVGLPPGQWKWHVAAASGLPAMRDCRDEGPGWDAWRRHLGRRKRPRPLAALLKSDRSPLLWALGPEGEMLAGDRTWLRQIVDLKTKKAGDEWAAELTRWLDEADTAPQVAPQAIESLAWCHALPRLAGSVSAASWWSCLGFLIETAHEAGDVPADDPLAGQLFSAELPLTLAYLFPEIEVCRDLATTGRRSLLAGIDELLDKGLPRFEHFPLLRPLLACWVRSRAIFEALDIDCQEVDAALTHMVRHALALSRADGSAMLTDEKAQPEDFKDLIAVALRGSGQRENRRIARVGRKNVPAHKLSRPGLHSEWSEAGLLRANWSPTSPRLTIGYARRQLAWEFDCGREVLWSGPGDPEILLDGVRLVPSSDWEEVCWESDRDVDYLELEINLGDGAKLERQMLLAREDRFLLSADAVLLSRPGRIDYRMTLPLAGSAAFEAAAETREGIVRTRKPRALVLPLALPEWRRDPRVGALETTAGGLLLRQSAVGQGLFAPLFFDLDRRRRGKPVTWRQLTVAENRQLQRSDVAAGYRVQIGKSQWLIYRSLNGAANRTVLGHHLLTQFLAGRFNAKGEVDTLLEIE
jgi:hypothetical protein